MLNLKTIIISKNNHGASNLFTYNYNILKSPIYLNNSIRIIGDNIYFLKETVNLNRSTKKLIALEIYILRGSNITRIIITELLKKRKEGVYMIDFLEENWKIFLKIRY